MSPFESKEIPSGDQTKDDVAVKSTGGNKMRILALVLGVTTAAFMGSTIALAVQKSKDSSTTSSSPAPSDTTLDLLTAHAPRNSPNKCEGKKPKHLNPGDNYFDNVQCIIDGVIQVLEQAGGNVSAGYKGDMDVGERVPITTPFFEAGLWYVFLFFLLQCVVVH